MDHDGDYVIDLILAIRPIMRWNITADDLATGSDHQLMEWEMGVDIQEKADHKSLVGWNIAAMTEQDFEAAENLWIALPTESAHLRPECA